MRYIDTEKDIQDFKEYVKEKGGKVQAVLNEYKGTTFKIEVPARANVGWGQKVLNEFLTGEKDG